MLAGLVDEVLSGFAGVLLAGLVGDVGGCVVIGTGGPVAIGVVALRGSSVVEGWAAEGGVSSSIVITFFRASLAVSSRSFLWRASASFIVKTIR